MTWHKNAPTMYWYILRQFSFSSPLAICWPLLAPGANVLIFCANIDRPPKTKTYPRHSPSAGQLNIDCKIQNTILSQDKNLASPRHLPSAGQLLALSQRCKTILIAKYKIQYQYCRFALQNNIVAIIYNINNILQIRRLTEQESSDPAFEWGSECYFGSS